MFVRLKQGSVSPRTEALRWSTDAGAALWWVLLWGTLWLLKGGSSAFRSDARVEMEAPPFHLHGVLR